jgi:hypothetical protein
MAANQEVKSLWHGPSGTIGSSEEDTLFYPGELGKTAYEKPSTEKPVPSEYQKVLRRAADTVAAADGALAFWSDLDDCVVCNEPGNAIGGSTNPLVAGVFRGTKPGAGKYGLIQIGGISTCQVTSGTVAAGGTVVPTTDNAKVTEQTQFGATTGAIKIIVGRALAAGDTTNGVSVILTLPRFGR